MRREFLTVYDYDTGGVWQYIRAESEEQILSKYPQLRVFAEPPAWWQERPMENLHIFDVEAEPTGVLLSLSREGS